LCITCKALATSKLSKEVGEGREFNRLPSDEIAASLGTFDGFDDLGSFTQDLESVADAVAAADYEREPVVEENISASRSMITGDRGNVYYTEELKRTIDDMIALGGGTGVSPSEKEPEPDLPAVLRSQSEVENSLEGLIISGEAASRFEADDSLRSKDVEKKDKAAPAVDPKLGGQSKTGEILPETTSMDLDQLKALEAMAEGDFSWTDIQSSPKIEPEVPKSREAVILRDTTSAKSPQDKDQLKSLETKVEGDFSWAGIPPSSKVAPEVSKSCEPVKQPVTTTSAKSPQGQDLLKSLETKDEGDFSWTDIQPSSKVEPELPKSREPVKQPVSTTSAKSPQDQARVKPVEGKTKHDQSAESSQDRDQMKALEEMLEAQMTDSSLDTKGRNVSHVEPTKSAKQQVKANVSEQVTSSALQTTETIKVTPRTGFEENPHYVEEVLSAAASKPKDKP